MKAMKVWHFIFLILAIVGLFATIHYFTHHKGQNPVSAYLPAGR